MKPEGWTEQNETDYQAVLASLKKELDQADPGMRLAEYMMLSDELFGRDVYLRAKANGWL
jgi:hypothetical protein